MLQYVLSFKETNLIVAIEEKGVRRVLYWDVLTKVATQEDREILLFFRKILTRFSQNLETLPFHRIEIGLKEACDVMRLLSMTNRVIYNKKPLLCDWKQTAELFFLASDTHSFSPFLKWGERNIPLEACEKIFPNFVIWETHAFPIRSSLSSKWIEFFKTGPRILQDVEKRRFLDEEPSIRWEKKEETPRLLLTDSMGSFANLSQDRSDWEKDLMEVGYERKIVGSSQYFCPSDLVHDALLILLEVGWEIFLSNGKKLYRQTKTEWEIVEKEKNLAVSAAVWFQDKKTALRPFMGVLETNKRFLDLDSSSVGLIDRKKSVVLEGVWESETLLMPRSFVGYLRPLFDLPEVKWEESIQKTIQGLKDCEALTEVVLDDTFRGELLPHQQKGVDWLSFLYRGGFSGLLADEMGLGKTVQALAFFSSLKTNLPILIVAPASLLFQWMAEIHRFLPQKDVFVFAGKDRSLKELQNKIVICSYAILREEEEALSQTQWEVILLDESQAIKTQTTQTATAAYKLKGRFRIALSGTPMENRLEELASQFHFLLPGLIRDPKRDHQKVKPFILRRKKDSIALPEKIEETCFVEMEEPQEKFYRSYVQSIQSGLLKKIAADGVSLHRMEILETILRLRQIAVDPRLMGSEIRGVKIQRLFNDLDEALQEKRKILIYSQFTSMLTLIAKELHVPFLTLDGSTPAIERMKRVEQFQNDPDISLFLLSLKAGGVGLNLTAADYVLLMDPWWNEAVENQAVDRAHRLGQKKSVIVKRYIVPGTIEEKILELKAKKLKEAQAILDSAGAFNGSAEDLLYLLT